MEEIKVKYFVDGIDELCAVVGKSDWIDLHAAEDVTLKAGEFRLIPLGVAMALPEGYVTPIVPLGCTSVVYGMSETNARRGMIEKNARICQFRIMQNQPSLTFTRVEHLEGPDRGGFGSTGK